MTEYQSRRERREAEARASGHTAVAEHSSLQGTEPEVAVSTPGAAAPASPATPREPNLRTDVSAETAAGLTRRERRMVEAGQAMPVQRVTPSPSMVLAESLNAADSETESEGINSRARTEQAADVNETVFTGSNLLSEPKTRSIILPVVPEMSLPSTSTGEIFTTGSVSILSEPVDSINTGSLDGLELDRLAAADAVTGALSVVQPVSALSVIRERESVAVVPTRALRRGWWQPWVIAAAAAAMFGGAVYVALIIFEALDG